MKKVRDVLLKAAGVVVVLTCIGVTLGYIGCVALAVMGR